MHYPRLHVQPGTYQGQFTMDGRRISGVVHLEADRHVSIEMFEDGKPGSFPKHPEFVERLQGRLWTGYEVSVHDLWLQEWHPGRYSGRAAFAVVGLEVNDALDRLTCLDIQLEGLDTFFDFAPIKEVRWPHKDSDDYSAAVAEGSRVTWQGPDIEIACGYAQQIDHLDGYSFHVSFAPIITVTSKALSPGQWLQDWLRPLISLVSFCIRSASRATCVVFTDRDDRGVPTAMAQLFGSGILQQPNSASRPDRFSSDEAPLLTRADVTDFPSLIENWRALHISDNPFPELFQLASDSELPLRARFSTLIQALEALHTFEAQTADAARKESHLKAREEIVTIIKEKIDSKTARAVKQLIPSRPMDGLDRRLNELIRVTPQPVVARLGHGQADPLVRRYSKKGQRLSFAEVVRLVRNDLSHGNHNPSPQHLLPWIRRLDGLAKAQMLRLLGFDDEVIGSRLGGSPNKQEPG